MRRPVLPWVVATVLLLVVTGSGLLVARATVFTASAFVQTYLDALERGDAAGALGMPGVRIPDARTDLLTTSGLRTDSDARASGERTEDGEQVVTVTWRHGDDEVSTELRVRQTGSAAGLLPQWAFAVSPVATTKFTILGGSSVRVGGTRIDIAAVQRGTRAGAPFAMLVPGAWNVDLDDRMARLSDRELVHQRVGVAATVTATLEATSAFTNAVDRAVGKVLAACVQQHVLYPPGCPFGEEITDRLASPPTWSVSDAPRIRLAPVGEGDRWATAPTSGTAHLTGTVRSIFDGTVTPLDEDVDFVASWDVRLHGATVTLGALRG